MNRIQHMYNEAILVHRWLNLILMTQSVKGLKEDKMGKARLTSTEIIS